MLTVRYSAVGLACIIYDHALSFGDELQYIWKRGRWDFLKFIFIWNRYVAEAGLIFGAYRKSGGCQYFPGVVLKSRNVSVGRPIQPFYPSSEYSLFLEVPTMGC